LADPKGGRQGRSGPPDASGAGAAPVGSANDSRLLTAGTGPQRTQLWHLARTLAARVAARQIRTLEAANLFLREHYIAEFNAHFRVPPAQPGSAFMPRANRDLDLIFSLQFERMVNRDNTVNFQNLVLQIEPVRWRATLASCNVVVHQHLDGTLSLTHGPHRLGRYTAQGVAIVATKAAPAKAVEKTLRGKVQKQTFPPRLEISQNPRDSHFPTASAAAGD